MSKIMNLELLMKLPKKFNLKTGIPINSEELPFMLIPPEGYNLLCRDGRREHCEHHYELKNISYCIYHGPFQKIDDKKIEVFI